MESRTTTPGVSGHVPVTDEHRAAREHISVRLAQIGFILPGTITQRMRRCGKANCHCAADDAVLHGPYIQWTRTVAGKTVTKQLSPAQWARYRTWFDDARALRDLANRLEALSLEAIQHAEGWGAKT